MSRAWWLRAGGADIVFEWCFVMDDAVNSDELNGGGEIRPGDQRLSFR
jgi:hypothetical protein